jgi:hypothetical protein
MAASRRSTWATMSVCISRYSVGLFVLLGQRAAFAVAHVARQQQLGRRRHLAPGRRVRAPAQLQAQLHLAHLRRGGGGHDAALAHVGQRLQHQLGRAPGWFHRTLRSSACRSSSASGERGAKPVSAMLRNDSVSAPRSLKPQPASRRGQPGAPRPAAGGAQTTTLTSRPGTTTTFLAGLPSAKRMHSGWPARRPRWPRGRRWPARAAGRAACR